MADDKKDVKTEKSDPVAEAVERAVKAALETAIPVAAKLSAEVNKPPAKWSPRIPVGGQCGECGQPQFLDNGKLVYACNSEHVKMNVLPNESVKWFPGIFLNGVKYISNDHSHHINVPKENDFHKYLEDWDRQEREYRTGRKVTPSQYNPVTRPPQAR